MILMPASIGLFKPAATAGANLATEILADNPWAYYQLGESAGATTYVDSSPNARNLSTLLATITAGSTALCAPGTSVDNNGSGYISSSSNQYGAAQATAFNGDKAITYVFVINLDNLSAARVPLHLGNASVNGSQGVFTELRTNGAVRFQLYDSVSAGYKFVDSSASAITATTNRIIICRRNVGGAVKIDVGSSTVGTGTMTGSIAMAATAASGGSRVMLGGLNAATPVNKVDGRMQHFAVFDAYISDVRVAAYVAASGL